MYITWWGFKSDEDQHYLQIRQGNRPRLSRINQHRLNRDTNKAVFGVWTGSDAQHRQRGELTGNTHCCR
ncbi:hypothetical protein J4Q44_G00304440 [Coregonus suidteri]|uniref:Uncharacterized protein n=1 Tax=Coregonus suidteri TaxID=861788 RepID=A0AAN8L0Z2_9TELE